ncbi:MAG: response regulator [Burkholderiales bacterium]|nr:response regulator [Burkholderiales bacterium]
MTTDTTKPKGCDVLIADDSGQCRDILRALLRTFTDGLTIREVRNGQEAIQACLSLNPRVTFLDIDMPEVDGLAALQQIRAKNDDAFIAIVSGRSSADNVRRALTTGANGFVVKPYKPQRILDVLERYEAKSGKKMVVQR